MQFRGYVLRSGGYAKIHEDDGQVTVSRGGGGWGGGVENFR